MNRRVVPLSRLDAISSVQRSARSFIWGEYAGGRSGGKGRQPRDETRRTSPPTAVLIPRQLLRIHDVVKVSIPAGGGTHPTIDQRWSSRAQRRRAWLRPYRRSGPRHVMNTTWLWDIPSRRGIGRLLAGGPEQHAY